MPGRDLIDAIDAARIRPGPAQLEEVYRIALLYSADDRACRDVLDRLTRSNRAEVAKAWADHHVDRTGGAFVGARWHVGPSLEGFYVLYQSRDGQPGNFDLMNFEDGECRSERGGPPCDPASIEFEDAKWLGPVEKP